MLGNKLFNKFDFLKLRVQIFLAVYTFTWVFGFF